MTPQLVASVAISLLSLACVADPQPPATDEPGPADTLAATATPQATGRVTLNAVGDLMLARDIVTLMDEHGSGYPFEAVRELLADADVMVANLEGTFTERGEAVDKLYTFRTPPRHARGLAEAGIDLVALGNNHTLDFGVEGLADTLAALEAAGVRYSGAGANDAAARRPALLTASGLRLAFLSFSAVSESTPAGEASPGVAWGDAAKIGADVTAAKREADLVIVSLHAGVEYQGAPRETQRALARAAV